MRPMVVQEEFYKILNQSVFQAVLGRRLEHEEIHQIVHGMADVIFGIVYGRRRVCFGDLGVFKPRIVPAGLHWNPKVGKKVDLPERLFVVFRTSKKIKRLIREQREINGQKTESEES